MLTGGCYCGALRYELDGEPMFRGQCHCRECQKIAGGAENYFMAVPVEGYRYVKGEPAQYRRPDLENPVTREFCATCGTHLATRSPRRPNAEILKVGGLDDPSVFGGPQVVFYTSEAQPFHQFPDGVPAFEKFPPPR